MRALIVSHEWERRSPGGAQRSAAALAHALAQTGEADVTLASAVDRLPAEAPDGWLDRGEGFAQALVESRTDAAFFTWSDPRAASAWADLIRQVRPDVVHLHHYFHVGIDLPLVVRASAPDAGLVLTLHEYMAICLRSGQMVDGDGDLCLSSGTRRCAECVGWAIDTVAARSDYVRRGLAAADVLVAPSRFARSRYRDWAGDAIADVRVVDNAVEFPSRVDPSAGGAGGLRLLFVGQHTPYKGLEVLLRAVARASADAPGAIASLDVYGDGSDRFSPEFHASLTAALAAGEPLVRTRGRYAQADLPAMLDAADAVVVPSTWWENSPVVIEEALARRVPVICSDIGGMAEKVRHGVDGWHFPVGNAAALAELLVALADADRRLPGMRRPAAIEDVARAHLEAYGEALAQRRASSH
jgi:glycosyltransferase involved in cell wall biosynthesis